MGRCLGGAPFILALFGCIGLCSLVQANLTNATSSSRITLRQEQIFVDIKNGTRFSLLVDLDQTVQVLRADINEHEGLPIQLLQPQLGDIILDYDTKLSDYNIKTGTTLTLVIPDERINHTIDFTIETLDGRQLPVTTQLGNLVSSLKANITQWTGICQEEQRLLFEGKELKDKRRLFEYQIIRGTRLKLGRPLEDCRRIVHEVTVLTLSGATIKIELNLAYTVDELKKRIRNAAGVPSGVQRLFAHGRLIVGDDHLCDLGLDLGENSATVVFMLLHSPRITSLDQVALIEDIREPVANENYEAPIFREIDNPIQTSGHYMGNASLYRDTRNWIVGDGSRPYWTPSLFDPVAYLSPNPDDNDWMLLFHDHVHALESPLREDASELSRMESKIMSARLRLSSLIEPYCKAAHLGSQLGNTRQYPGVALGGGSGGSGGSGLGYKSTTSACLVSIGADVNNWAPDAIADSDLMILFNLTERVRKVLANDARTGGGTLGFVQRRRINNAILATYLEALAGYPSTIDYSTKSLASGECRICHDELSLEPASMLPCQHAFHLDCLFPWVSKLYPQSSRARCPYCNERFYFSFEAIGKALLGTHDLRLEE